MDLTIEQALQQGVVAHNSGNVQEAERLYRAILQSQPAHPDANHNLGLIAISVNQIEAALPLFKTALDVNPSVEQFWVSYIDALVKNNQLADAKKVIKKAKKKGINGEKLDTLLIQLKAVNDTLVPSHNQLASLLDCYQNGRLGEAEKLAISISLEFPNHPFSWKVLGAVLAQTGRNLRALTAIQTAVGLSPQDAEGHSSLGNVLSGLSRFDEATVCYSQAIALRPDYAEAHNNLGNVLNELGRFYEAEESYKEAIALKPDYAKAHSNLGFTLLGLGRLGEAEESCGKAIELKPDFVEAHINLGITLRELGRLEEAETRCRQVIALKPDYAEAHNNLGTILEGLGRLEEAEASYKLAISLRPDYPEAYSNMGITLQGMGKLDDAKVSCRQAIALKADYAEAHNNLGNVLKDLSRFVEAEASYRQAIALKPHSPNAYCNLGVSLQEVGKFGEAEASYKQAIALEPDFADAHHNLSLTLLNDGRLKEGLDKYEWRWKKAENLPAYRHFAQPLWDGQESLQGKRILLWSEQGIGDTINWASCLPLVASLAEHTILECQEKIVTLLARSFPGVEIKPEDRSMDSQRDDFDFHLPMGSLYRHFISHIGKNSNIDGYLIPDPVRVKFWRDRLNALGEGPYVGISWKSSEVSPFRLKHYPPISEWFSVLTVSDVTFINLQYVDSADDLAKIKDDIGVVVHNFGDLDHYNNVDDVTALCAALDMVVSTKVTPMIFSSGAGTPTKVANWRQSTWNNVLTNPVCSSIEMFHRDTSEPWDKVFHLISEEIIKLKNTTSDTKDKL